MDIYHPVKDNITYDMYFLRSNLRFVSFDATTCQQCVLINTERDWKSLHALSYNRRRSQDKLKILARYSRRSKMIFKLFLIVAAACTSSIEASNYQSKFFTFGCIHKNGFDFPARFLLKSLLNSTLLSLAPCTHQVLANIHFIYSYSSWCMCL